MNSTRATRICFVRHGETDDNARGVFQGHGGKPLNAAGMEQARKAAERLAPHGWTACYSSDLARAKRTAELISYGKESAPTVTADARLREVDVGAWEGLPRDQLIESFPDEWEKWARGEDVRRGGGETYRETATRVLECVRECLTRHHGSNIIVVSHGGAIRAAVATWIGCPMHALAPVRNTAICIVEVDESHPPRLALWNDASHLD